MNYNITYTTITNWLLPPRKRNAKYKAFIKAITKPLQWLNDLFASDYVEGQQYPDFNNLTVYYPGDRITFTDNRNYERTYQDSMLPVSGQPPDAYPNYWIVIQDNFIGAFDRAKFNGQIIMLEYQLNVWFKNPLPANQIYINNVSAPLNFWLGNSSATSGKLSNLSANSSAFMSNASAPQTNHFTVYVPSALYTTLGSNATNRENAVRRFVDKYKLSGITYNVTTY